MPGLSDPSSMNPAAARSLWPPVRGVVHGSLVRHLMVLGWLALGWSGGYQPARAQEPANGKPAMETVTEAMVHSRFKQAEESGELSEEQKERVRQWHQEALQALDAEKMAAKQTYRYQHMLATAAEQLEQVRARLAELPAQPSVEDPRDASLGELRVRLEQHETELAKAQEEVKRLQDEPARRQSRRTELRDLVTMVQQELPKLEGRLASPPPDEEPEVMSLARRTRLLAQRQARVQELAAYEKELAAYAATVELLPLQRDLAVRQAALAQQQVRQLREVVQQRQLEESRQKAEAAKLEAALAHLVLQPLAQHNQQLAEQDEQLVQRLKRLTADLQQESRLLEDLQREYRRTEEKVELVGLSEAVGLLLRKRRQELPDVAQRRRSLRDRQPEIRSAQLQWMELEDERSKLADLDRQVLLVLEDLGPPPADLTQADLEFAVRDLLEKQRNHLDRLLLNYNRYFESLIELDNVEQQVVEAVEAYAHYIDERVLWTRSTTSLGPAELPAAGEALLWLVDPQGWAEVGQAVLADVRQVPWIWATALLGLVPLVYFKRRFRLLVSDLGQQAERGGCHQIAPTLRALLLTAWIAVPWPALLLFLGWRLMAVEFGPRIEALAGGLIGVAAIFLPLEFFRHVCRTQGLAESHFGWPSATRQLLRRHLRWLLPVGLPLMLVVQILQAQENIRWQNSLGRLSFLAVLLVGGVFMHLVLRPASPLMCGLLARQSQSWLYRLRHFWYLLGVIAPLALGVLAVLGYYYTAYKLAFRLQTTVGLLAALVILAALLLRWLLIHRRKLARQQARERLLAAQSEGPAEQATDEAPGLAQVGEPVLDLTAISSQSRQLLHAALVSGALLAIWWTWVDVLPALGILHQVTLWEVAVQEQLRPVTLGHLALAGLIGVISTLSIKNIPGLLELLVLQHLPLDAGARYAVITIFRYVIIVVAVVVVFTLLGIEWTHIQWLVAAATVGLAFGLQEIFANFVSGLIVLLERPIRMGDVVTVEGVTGVVSQIQMRATTVTNFDQQEFIIPNKEFVTGRLINWTLTNSINRVVIPVGVAYGSDTELAQELLLRLADEHPFVLDDPPPYATFEGFGDSSLNFVLRCCLPSMEKRLATIHELHTAIDQAFRQAGIEIAFPQRDIHVRSITGPSSLDQTLASANGPPASTATPPGPEKSTQG